jgi:hypothetical protein
LSNLILELFHCLPKPHSIPSPLPLKNPVSTGEAHYLCFQFCKTVSLTKDEAVLMYIARKILTKPAFLIFPESVISALNTEWKSSPLLSGFERISI